MLAWLVSLAILTLIAPMSANAAESSASTSACAERPIWCKPGFSCAPTSCTTRSTVALERLGAQLVAARAERPRWFRPFLEGGVTWSPTTQTSGAWGEAGILLWRRLEFSAAVTEDELELRAGYRREW